MDSINKIHSKPSYEQLEKQLKEIQKNIIRDKKRITEGEKRFESLYKNAPLPYHSLDEEGCFTEVNPAWLSTMGYSQEEVLGQYYGDFLHSDWKEHFKTKFPLFKEKGHVHTLFKIRHKRGHYLDIDLNGNILYNLDGTFKQTNCVFQDITELEQSRNELEKSESIHQKMVSNIGDVVIVFDEDGIIRYKSENVQKHFGWEARDFFGKSTWDKIHPDDVEKSKELVLSLVDKPNESITTELRYLCKSGEYRWIQFTLLNLLNDPEIKGFLGNYHDISEKKQRENELILKNIAFDSSISANSTADINGILTNVNKAYIDLYGYNSSDEVIGKHLSRFITHDYDVTKIINALNSDGHWSGEHVAFKKNGEEFTVLANASTLRDADNNFIGYQSSGVDVTYRKRADEVIKQSEKELFEQNKKLRLARKEANENLEMILSSQSLAHICSYSTNLDEHDLEKSNWLCSPEFYKIFGIDETYPHTIAGWARFIHPDHREVLLAYHEYVVKNRISFNHEYKIIRINDGEERWVQGSGELVYDKQGKAVRMHGAIQDITEQKQIQQELIDAKDNAEESDRLKSAFLSNMSHEIRTPMNGILGFTDLLQSSDLSIENQQRYISIIQQSGERLLNTVNDIVEISRIESGEVRLSKDEIEIVNHLENLVTFHKTEAMNKGLVLSIENEIDEHDLVIHTDKIKLDSILTNLIKNAIKYTNEGAIKVGLQLKGGHLIFCCKDSGIGIPKNRQNAIFNRFEQADIEDKQAHQGSGLGLAIVKSYVEMLGGEIWLESEEGKGALFCVSLPHHPIKKIEQLKVKNDVFSELNKKSIKVLIVEDDEFSSLHLSAIIDEIVHIFHCVPNGVEALDAIRKDPSIDLILMDMKMPKMNGFDATREIRKFNKKVIIIAQTAFAFEEDKRKALAVGCNDFIAKPIKKNELVSLINKYF